MLLMYGTDHFEEYKRSLIKFVYQNLFTAMHSMIHAMHTLKIQYRNKRNEVYRDI